VNLFTEPVRPASRQPLPRSGSDLKTDDLTMTNPDEKIVSMRVLEIELYEAIKTQAKAEGVLVKEWINRALHHELVRVRRERTQLEAQLGEE
jgi:hypothetical protein